ncbi:TetR/AcrR family transcriptional regulator [Paenibacillus sp. LK1]|uniref:TetR/AcrR family transcriptional regulator n=1 Tax=Paenibacillus TaxID=44249 RepID=UPI000C1A213D|nr:TetR/AcrR family transcriptional regulator [Paenibacillus sp. LK1]PIH58776.1 TetR family transcriptional regulator [Paenibacillus sp. LK1]
MPKKTFFHLSKDKQDTLIQCAKREFSRVPLHEASIANIIKDAGISRGSFYQYFEEKEDLYYYLLNQSSQKNSDRFIAALKEKNGDVFEAFIDSFQFMIQNHTNQEHKNFFRNAFLNMNYKTEKTFTKNIYEENRDNHLLPIIGLMNTETLNIQGERELQHILKIIIAVTFDNLIQVFVKDLTYEEASKNYGEQMELLKRGFKKI